MNQMNDSFQVSVLEQLQQNGALQPSQLPTVAEQARQQHVDTVSLIQQQRLVDPEVLAQAIGGALNMPYVLLVDQDIPHEVLQVITRDVAENYRVVPWSKKGNEVTIALVDPRNYKAIEALDFIARRDQLHFQYSVTSEASWRSVLRQYDNLTHEVSEFLQTGDDAIVDDVEKATEQDIHAAPVSKTISVILRYAVEGNASDVHIEPAEDGTRVRYRVDGKLHTSLQLPTQIHAALVARIKVLANLKLDETRLPQDGRFRMNVEGRTVDFRVSTMPLLDKEKVVLRILDQAGSIRSLEELGFMDHTLALMNKHSRQPHGMIILSGPTGSGKSTTLYAMLQMLNDEERNIITLEDPVEYSIPGVSQSQVRPEIGLTFANGLRSVLRQDPDVVMVGEIRDNETAELAIHAALTGHMLLSTLHTNDALGAIPRLIDMGIEPFLISSSLNLVVAQRLVRKLCEHCAAPATLAVELEMMVVEELSQLPASVLPKDISLQLPLQTSAAPGCPRCEETGYKGRIAIAESLEMTKSLQEIIVQGLLNDHTVMAEELQRQGMITLKQDGFIKVLRGRTTVEEVLSTTQTVE